MGIPTDPINPKIKPGDISKVGSPDLAEKAQQTGGPSETSSTKKIELTESDQAFVDFPKVRKKTRKEKPATANEAERQLYAKFTGIDAPSGPSALT